MAHQQVRYYNRRRASLVSFRDFLHYTYAVLCIGLQESLIKETGRRR